MYKLLIAEDEKKVRSGLKKLIERFRYPVEVVEASNGEEARILLEQSPVDILMTDVEMPLISGLALGAIARRLYPDIKIIIFSAYSKFEYARSAITLDAVHYLLKPIDINEFKGVMGRVLDLCSQEKPASLRFLTNEQDRMFRDSFRDSSFTENILYKIPYFNDTNADMYYTMIYLYINRPELFDYMEGIRKLMSVAGGEDNHIFFIDEKQCILAFKHLYYKSPDIAGIHTSITSLFHGKTGEGPILYTLIGKDVRGIHAIKEELGHILKLSELTFYITDHMVMHTDYEPYAGYKVNSLDTGPIVEAIDKDIEDGSFLKLKADIGTLIQALKANSQISPLYVKYIFSDILWKLADAVDSSVLPKIEAATKSIMTISNIALLEDSLYPVIDQLDTGIEAGSRIVERILQCIREEYAKDLSLDYIADKVFLSPSYTSSLFKKETGQTLTYYINQVRMKKAKELLKSTNMKLVDVSLAVGYSSQIYFSMLFKNLFGMTPTQYRDSRQ